jgi:hypothetical protein
MHCPLVVGPAVYTVGQAVKTKSYHASPYPLHPAIPSPRLHRQQLPPRLPPLVTATSNDHRNWRGGGNAGGGYCSCFSALKEWGSVPHCFTTLKRRGTDPHRFAVVKDLCVSNFYIQSIHILRHRAQKQKHYFYSLSFFEENKKVR